MTWISPSFDDPTTAPAYTAQLRPMPYPGYGGWYKSSAAKRGVLLYCPEIQTGSWKRTKMADVAVTPPMLASQFGPDLAVFSIYEGELLANLFNDGWDIYYVAYPEIGSNAPAPHGIPSIPAMGIQQDATNDPNHGLNYTTVWQKTLEHAVRGINADRGSSCPIGILGASHGGWSTLQAVAYLGSRLTWAAVLIPVTRWSGAGTGAVAPAVFNNINMSGMDVGIHLLDSVPASVQLLLSYGTADTAVGFSQTTVDTGSLGADVSTLTTLNVTDATQLASSGPGVIVPTNSGTGFAVIFYTGKTGNQLTGCSCTFGSGLIQAGTVVQNTIKPLIAQAISAGQTVLDNHTAGGHSIDMLSSGMYFPLAGPTALTSLSTLTLNTTIAGATFTSGQTKLRTTNGTWHTVTFTGQSTTTVSSKTVATLTGCSYSGTLADTVALGSPVVSSGTVQSVLWWLSQNVDINCPAIF